MKFKSLALLIGLVLARHYAPANEIHLPPPLPEAHGSGGAYASPERLRAVEWYFASPYLDVLEFSTTADFAAIGEIPGPYRINAGSYHVVIDTTRYTQLFFRVRRVWGNPWI